MIAINEYIKVCCPACNSPLDFFNFNDHGKAKCDKCGVVFHWQRVFEFEQEYADGPDQLTGYHYTYRIA